MEAMIGGVGVEHLPSTVNAGDESTTLSRPCSNRLVDTAVSVDKKALPTDGTHSIAVEPGVTGRCAGDADARGVATGVARFERIAAEHTALCCRKIPLKRMYGRLAPYFRC